MLSIQEIFVFIFTIAFYLWEGIVVFLHSHVVMFPVKINYPSEKCKPVFRKQGIAWMECRHSKNQVISKRWMIGDSNINCINMDLSRTPTLVHG